MAVYAIFIIGQKKVSSQSLNNINLKNELKQESILWGNSESLTKKSQTAYNRVVYTPW